MLQCQQAISATEVQIRLQASAMAGKKKRQRWKAQADLQASDAVIWGACRVMPELVLVPILMLLSREIIIVFVIEHPLF